MSFLLIASHEHHPRFLGKAGHVALHFSLAAFADFALFGQFLFPLLYWGLVIDATSGRVARIPSELAFC